MDMELDNMTEAITCKFSTPETEIEHVNPTCRTPKMSAGEVILITGGRGQGKTAIAFDLAEKYHKETDFKVYVIGIPIGKQKLFPCWFKFVENLDEIPNGSMIVVEESGINFESTRNKKGKKVTLLEYTLEICRHKDLRLVFINIHSAGVNVDIVRSVDVLIIKQPSFLQARMERPALRKLTKDAQEKFNAIAESERKRHAYMISNSCEGMITNGLPSFWSSNISTSYSGTEKNPGVGCRSRMGGYRDNPVLDGGMVGDGQLRSELNVCRGMPPQTSKPGITERNKAYLCPPIRPLKNPHRTIKSIAYQCTEKTSKGLCSQEKFAKERTRFKHEFKENQPIFDTETVTIIGTVEVKDSGINDAERVRKIAPSCSLTGNIGTLESIETEDAGTFDFKNKSLLTNRSGSGLCIRGRGRLRLNPELTISDFNEFKKKFKIISFTASWCPHCKSMKENVFSKLDNKIYKNIDADSNQVLTHELRIEQLPTTFIIEDGKIVKTLTGEQKSLGKL